MAYGDFKNLTKRIVPGKVLRDEAFNNVKKTKYDGYQRGLASTVYKFFEKKASGSGFKSINELNQQLAEKLCKSVIRKFEKRKVYSSFTDNI